MDTCVGLSEGGKVPFNRELNYLGLMAPSFLCMAYNSGLYLEKLVWGGKTYV